MKKMGKHISGQNCLQNNKTTKQTLLSSHNSPCAQSIDTTFVCRFFKLINGKKGQTVL